MNELEQAREWAALWKRAAKRYRDALHYISGGVVPVSWMPLQEELDRARAWSRAWKASARWHHDRLIAEAGYSNSLYLATAAKDAEIERLRKGLAWYVGRSAESLIYDGGRRAARVLSGEEPADD